MYENENIQIWSYTVYTFDVEHGKNMECSALEKTIYESILYCIIIMVQKFPSIDESSYFYETW